MNNTHTFQRLIRRTTHFSLIQILNESNLTFQEHLLTKILLQNFFIVLFNYLSLQQLVIDFTSNNKHNKLQTIK